MKTRLIKSVAFAAIFFGTSVIAAAQQPATVLDIKTSISDNNIVYPETFEMDTQKMLEGWYMKNYTDFDDRYRRMDDRKTDDNTIKERLAKLPTKIELPYNQIVRSYIDRYTQGGRDQVTLLLGLSNYYNPIFEQALEERGLPLELKYLPVVESALNPNAVSKHGATGLWQFMINTAKGLGLEVNSLVDERRDPYVSSKAAAQYLADLYATYGDWSLALAAYNSGPNAINKAIRRAGGDPKSHDFWSIYNYLTPETRGYVPMFIAANYVMNYYPEHNISPVIPTKPLVVDTLKISEPIHFNQISAVLDIPVDELRVLNPQFRNDMIPGSKGKQYTLILPSQQIHSYLLSEDVIRNYEADKYRRREEVNPGDNALAVNTVPVKEEEEEDIVDSQEPPVVAQAPVQTVTVKETKVEPRKVEPKPAVEAEGTKASRETTSQVQKNLASESNQGFITHKVEPGENIYTIATAYGVTGAQIKSWNNLSRSSVRVGQQLRVKAAKGKTQAVASAQESGSTAKNRKGAAVEESTKAENSKVETTKKETAKGETAKAETPKKETARERRARERREAQEKARAEAARTKTHTLKSGESLSSLSKKYGVSIDEIKKANNMKGDDIIAGDDIKIPGKKSSKTGSKSSGNSSRKSGSKRRR